LEARSKARILLIVSNANNVPSTSARTSEVTNQRIEALFRRLRVGLVSILLVSPYAADHLLIPRILAGSKWQCRHCHNWHHAAEILERNRIGVVLCERDQTNGSWRDVLETAHSQSMPPSVIVCSCRVDEVLWAGVLNLGGYDVLIKPFDHEEVLRVVSGAWRSWKGARGARLARNVGVEESTLGLRGAGSSQDSCDIFGLQLFRLRLNPWHGKGPVEHDRVKRR
jgi:DNA-binding response OmpR family regulator